MFGGLKNLSKLGDMLKNAQQIGARLQTLNDELRAKRALGSAGGGMVEFEVNGLGEVLRVKIDDNLVAGGDREMLEDLVAAAANQASQKARQLHSEMMQEMTGGMPGLEEALGKFTGGGE